MVYHFENTTERLKFIRGRFTEVKPEPAKPEPAKPEAEPKPKKNRRKREGSEQK